MPKGYWIAHVGADDKKAFSSDEYKSYVEGAAPCFIEYNGKFLARGGDFELVEGRNIGTRHVVVEFPSLEDAKACYKSDAYAQAKQHRRAVSKATIVLVEGFDG